LQTKPPREFPPEGKLSMTIHGELVGLGSVRDLQGLSGVVVDCDDLPHSYLDVVDSDYRMWRFLYSFSDLTVGRIKAQVGSRVTVKFRALLGFSKAAGFVVSDKTGIVLAVEDGAFGEGLSPLDEAPFSIRKADVFRLKQDQCGDVVVSCQGGRDLLPLPARPIDSGMHAPTTGSTTGARTCWVTLPGSFGASSGRPTSRCSGCGRRRDIV